MSNQQQDDPQWYQDRLGRLTASRYADAVAKLKDGSWGATRERYMGELVTERLTGVPYPSYVSLDMKHGTETQPEAMTAYSLMRDVDIKEVGFVPHPTIAMAGCSPDGMLPGNGLIEVKCVASHTMIAYLRGGAIPIANVLQCQWQMICTERDWCDWVAFDPRLPIELQLEIRRITRLSEPLVRKMEKDAEDFLAEVERVTDELEIKRQQKRAA